MTPFRRPPLLVAVALVAAVVGCSDGDTSSTADRSAGTSATSTSTTAPAAPLEILVTNDDGVGADGIDAVVEALRKVPGVEVTVVAPATNQSGSGGKTTAGALTATDATTKSGYPAKAVAGFPADTIAWAIGQRGIAVMPDLVVSGINQGQNVGPFVEISGTVGAARAAAAAGLPALAASQGTPDFYYPSGVTVVLAWLAEHRSKLEPGVAWSLNIPSCPQGTAEAGVIEVPVAADDHGFDLLGAQACPVSGSAGPSGAPPADDVAAFFAGYAALSRVN